MSFKTLFKGRSSVLFLLSIIIPLTVGFLGFASLASVRAATFEPPSNVFPLGNPELPTAGSLNAVLNTAPKGDAHEYTGNVILGDSTHEAKLGIGVTPSYPLQITNPSEFSFAYQRGTTGKLWAFGSDDKGFELKNITDNALLFYIANNGNVGIGTADPTHSKLDIEGTGAQGLTIKSTNHRVSLTNNDTNLLIASDVVPVGGTGNKVKINLSAPDDAFILDNNGNVGIGTVPGTGIKLHAAGVVQANDGFQSSQSGKGSASYHPGGIYVPVGSTPTTTWLQSPLIYLGVDAETYDKTTVKLSGTLDVGKVNFHDKAGDIQGVFDKESGKFGIGMSTTPSAKFDVLGDVRVTPTSYKYVSQGNRIFNGTPLTDIHTCGTASASAPNICYTVNTAYNASTSTSGNYTFYELRGSSDTDGNILVQSLKSQRIDLGLSSYSNSYVDGSSLEVVQPIYATIGLTATKYQANTNTSTPVRFGIQARSDGEMSGEDRAQLGTVSSHDLVFITNDSERMRITKEGGVTITEQIAGAPAPLTVYHPSNANIIINATRGQNLAEKYVTFSVGTHAEGTDVGWAELNVSSDNDLKIFTGGHERMKVRNDGNVVIGEAATPLINANLFTVDNNAWIKNINTNSVRLGGNGSGEYITSDRSSTSLTKFGLDFYTNNNDANKPIDPRMQITNDGRVGIGKSPAAANILDVNGNVAVSGDLTINGGKAVYNYKKDEGESLFLAGSNGTNIYLENLNGVFRLMDSGWTKELFNVAQDGDTRMRGNLAINGNPNKGAALTVNGDVNIGGTGISHLLVRHIDGKAADSFLDNLYLQYQVPKDTIINGGGSTGNVAIGFPSAIYPPDVKLSGYRLAVNGGIVNQGGDINVITASAGDRTASVSQKLAFATDRVGLDVAELFEAETSVEAGDVLIVGNKERKLKKSTGAYQKEVIGVVSGSPAIVFEGSELKIGGQLDRFTKGTKPPVALSGRIPVKVSTENGSIKPGDYLTTSNTPGVAMKATNPGPTIGIALESYGGKGQGKVLVFLKEGDNHAADLDKKIQMLANEVEMLKKKIK